MSRKSGKGKSGDGQAEDSPVPTKLELTPDIMAMFKSMMVDVLKEQSSQHLRDWFLVW